MFGLGKGKKGNLRFGKRKRFRKRWGEGLTLIDALSGEKYVVLANLNKKTLEMGIYPGVVVEIIKEGNEDTNMIVKIHDSQIIVPPNVARQIIVK